MSTLTLSSSQRAERNKMCFYGPDRMSQGLPTELQSDSLYLTSDLEQVGIKYNFVSLAVNELGWLSVWRVSSQWAHVTVITWLAIRSDLTLQCPMSQSQVQKTQLLSADHSGTVMEEWTGGMTWPPENYAGAWLTTYVRSMFTVQVQYRITILEYYTV